ncbi:MAG: UDP-glucose/GDP-mannose dehydrogenase family protein [Alphaproteobacteria bacterium]|nr:UDP-glucose/GDP-mannose dehydrogenase family protein [Alphaproteobacteria bacterium]
MRIAVIGTGYVGLVSGTCFSDFGFDVTCVDKNEAKISRLLKGEIPIYEPGLDTLVQKNARLGRLSFTTDLPKAVRDADVVFIAVGTPTRKEDGHADLSYVYAAAEEIAANLNGYKVIVTKSTVPVGTGKRIAEIIRQANPSGHFDVASNPEFLREGSAIEDFMHPDRVVVGIENIMAQEVMAKLYQPICGDEIPVLFTDIATSELIKYASNTFLAAKIAFINEMADLCEKVDANVQDVAKGIGMDSRIGSRFLQPGPGYGGSCFPKDTLALVKIAQAAGAPSRIIETVVEVNDDRKKRMAEKIIDAAGGSVEGRNIAVLGLTFKPDTDDMRDSPSLAIVPELVSAGAKEIRVYDPEGMKEAKKMLTSDRIVWCEDAYATLPDAHVLVIVTEWNEFRNLDLKRVARLMNAPVMVDLRNIYNPEDMAEQGFLYVSVGRREALPETKPQLRLAA